MKYIIAFFSVSLLVMPVLFSQSDGVRAPQETAPGYLGIVYALEGDRLIIGDGSYKTNGNYLVIEDAAGRSIERKAFHLPCEAMAEFKELPKGEKVVTRLVVLRNYDVIGGRLVATESF